MEETERTKKIIQFIRTYGVITNNDVQSLTSVHRNTATIYLKQLVQDGIILAEGRGKGTIYRLIEDLIFLSSEIETVFPKNKKKQLESYFKTSKRKRVFFNKVSQDALNADFSFPKNISLKFEAMKDRIDIKRKALSVEVRKQKKEKLVIDLSWASSNIEGNTYSLLETEGLLKYNQM